MKLLSINSVCGIRSTGRICIDIAEVLKLQGHDCKIAYGRETVPEKYQHYAVRIGSDIGVKIHALMSRFLDCAGFGSKRATKKFIEWVKEYDPDIIHLHNIHGYYINIELLFDYIKKAKKPVVWTLHDCWSFTGHCAHFDFEKCCKWQTKCYKCTQTREYPKSFFDFCSRNFKKKKNAFSGVENMAIVTPSKWLADLVKKSYLKDYSVKVIPNGIDLSVFKPTDGDFRKKYNLEDKKIVLGVASAWGTKKGLDDFVKMSEMLDDNYKIVLVGLTEEQKRALPESIIGITRTNDTSELAHLYTTADVFVNPTYEDTYPTVNIEAISCGTPVVTYNTGGSPEAMHGKGVVVPKGNIEEMVSEISEICLNEKSFDFGKEALFCNRDTCYSEYLNLYGSMF